MSNLDWQKHDKAIVDFVKKITNFYLRTEASTGKLLKTNQGILLRNNYATPALIWDLLESLQTITTQVADELLVVRAECIAKHIGIPLHVFLVDCAAGSSTYGLIFDDQEKWLARLAFYKEQTEAAIGRDPNASGDEDHVFWDNVTKPLLLGIYPGEEQQRRLDAVTPIVLAWQIQVAEKAYSDALTQLWKDLKEGVEKVLEEVTDFGGGLVLLAIAGLALGYGYGKGK